jgi:hypothetical protein
MTWPSSSDGTSDPTSPSGGQQPPEPTPPPPTPEPPTTQQPSPFAPPPASADPGSAPPGGDEPPGYAQPPSSEPPSPPPGYQQETYGAPQAEPYQQQPYKPQPYQPQPYQPQPYQQQPYQGQPYQQPYPPPAQSPGYNVMAILSLVFAFVFAPAGIVLGHIAKRQIRERREEGDGVATAGLILSYIFTGLTVLACCGALIVAGAYSNR